MQKILIILPYFGKFPNYFDLWLKSVELNPTIDFLLITDIKSEKKMPSNIRVIGMEFEELKRKIQDKFDFEITLNSPYKICDYRPAFGVIFSEYTLGYEFWGHCDADLIWGDLRKFLTSEILNNHEKIYTKGHLSLYKNNNKMNNLFKEREVGSFYSYLEAFKTSYPCHFDEDGALNYLCKERKIKVYNGFDYADISPKNHAFRIANDHEKKYHIFAWRKGKVIGYSIKKGSILEKEYSYVHIQKRKLSVKVKEDSNQFFILPNEFNFSKEELSLREMIIEYTKDKLINIDYFNSKKNHYIFKIKNEAISQKVFRINKKWILLKEKLNRKGYWNEK